MKDLNKIQEFFSKPLEENIVKAFDLQKGLNGMGYDVKVKYLDDFGKDVYEIYLNKPVDSDKIFFDAKKLGFPNVRIFDNMNEIDLNDPVLMKMRAAKDAVRGDSPASQGKRAAIGDDISRVNAKKIAFLKKERAQLMRDMEQEAEPEGGSIADEYGRKLNKIDAAIAKLSGRKEMDYDTAVGKVDENKILKQAKLSSAEYQKVKKLKDFNKDNYKWNPGESLYIKLNEAKVEFYQKGKKTFEKDFDTEEEANAYKAKAADMADTNAVELKEYTGKVSMPKFVKDKNNPNFLNVYIKYDTGAGATMALGRETGSGQDRRNNAAEAMKLANDVARDLEAEYNLEDIEITDQENGIVNIFAVSDDFVNMDPNMLGEVKIGDKVKINKEYGGGKGTIEDIVGSFVVVNGESYHESDVEKVGLDEEKGYSPQLVTPENPKGETKGLTPDVMNKILMKIIQDLDESSPGLWDNIRAKRERGEKPARKGSKAYKTAVKAGRKINKAKN